MRPDQNLSRKEAVKSHTGPLNVPSKDIEDIL